MPTGRPDFWYGTALYFEDNPADGEVTRGPTSNWAYDHKADADAHHSDPKNIHTLEIGSGDQADENTSVDFFAADSPTLSMRLFRVATANGAGYIWMQGTGDFQFWLNGTNEFTVKSGGGLTGCWDDTPTNGQATKGVTSDWAYDHVNAAAAHHAKYTDAEAVTAMGVKGDSNPLNHDLYTPADNTAMALGYSVGAAGVRDMAFYAEGNTNLSAFFRRDSGANGALRITNYGTGNIVFAAGGDNRFLIYDDGGVWGIWDDTPTNGETTKGVTSDWAYDHVNDVDAHGARFVDRGDPAAVDYTQATLTLDETWNDLDLSGILPSEASAVLLQITIQDNAVGSGVAFRQNGNSNGINIAETVTQVANVAMSTQKIVKCDSSQVIEYYGTNGLDSLTVTVCGWWI